MGKVPKPRKPGQTGGGGRIGHTSNRGGSQARGGNPYRGGGGQGKKPAGKSSSVEGTPIATLVYSIAGGVVLTLSGVVAYLAHGYGAF